MNKYKRIFIEVLAPPFLGAFIVVFTDPGGYSFMDRIKAFPQFLYGTYIFAIMPSCVYALAMELWFWFGLRARLGLLCTVAFSALLGCGAGAFIQHITDGDVQVVLLGALVGLVIGFVVGRRQPPNKSPEPTAVGAVSSAVAVHVVSRRWLSFLR